jgi:hypothetical protein
VKPELGAKDFKNKNPGINDLNLIYNPGNF